MSWLEERDGTLDLVRGHGLALDHGQLVTKLGHATLELVGLFVELGQALTAATWALDVL